MKKLLALVLCVMMFVAVIPTAAFADTATATNYKAWKETAVSSTAIKEAEKSIKNMYTAIATDELVFGTAKSLYDFSNGLATQMFDGVESMDGFTTKDKTKTYKTTYHDDLVANTRKYMNAIIGDSIAKYISDRADTFASTTINGGVDPEKYLNVFAAAVNDAVASEKAQKGIEAFIYTLYSLKVEKAVKDQAEDIQTAIKDWGSGKWDEFGSNFDLGWKAYSEGTVPTTFWNPAQDTMTRPNARTTSTFSDVNEILTNILNVSKTA